MKAFKNHIRILVNGIIYSAVVAIGFLLFLGLVTCVGWCWENHFWYPLIPIGIGTFYLFGLHLEQ